MPAHARAVAFNPRLGRRTLLAAAVLGGAFGAATSPAGASTRYRDTVLDTPGLVSYWRSGEAATASRAWDYKGRNTGAYRGGVRVGATGLLATSRHKAAAYDGIDDRIVVADAASLDLGRAFSLETWVEPASLPARATIVHKPRAYVLEGDGADLRLTFWDRAGRRRSVAAAGRLAAGHTSHVVGTYAAGALRLFVDGRLAGRARVPARTVPRPSATALTIGHEGFRGTIDESAVYEAALGAAEVAAHRSAGVGAAPKPAPAAPAPSQTRAPASSQPPSPAPAAPPAPGVPQPPSGPFVARLFDANADSGTLHGPYTNVEAEGGASASMLTTTAFPARTGGRAYKLTVPDPTTTQRLQPYTDQALARSGDEYWYGISLYLGDDFVQTDAQWGAGWAIFLSWRWQIGSREYNGPSSLSAERVGGRPVFSWNRTAHDIEWPDGAGTDSLDVGPATKGEWIDLVFHVKWSHDTSVHPALREVWRNGVLMGRSTRRNMRMDNPIRWKAGLYQGAMIDHGRTLYWDNHRIGRSYADVDPAG